MSAKEQTLKKIKDQQKDWADNWAKNQLIKNFLDSKKKNYTSELEYNLYQKLSPDSRKEFEAGGGHEIEDEPAKMKALHSSSALVVNVFEYLRQNNKEKVLAEALGISREGIIKKISYEERFTVLDKNKANLDLCIEYEEPPFIVAVESKFTEPYSKTKNEFSLSYFNNKNDSIWNDLPNLRKEAEKNDETYLHKAQLIKHTIGLMKKTGSKEKFQLIYLYYPIESEENTIHENEIKVFEKIIKQDDGINFKVLTWNKVIMNLKSLLGAGDMEYLDYIKKRYFPKLTLI